MTDNTAHKTTNGPGHAQSEAQQAAQAVINAAGDLWTMFRILWPTLIPEALTPAKHIPAICAELQPAIEAVAARKQKQHDFIINIPPGMSKSTISVMAMVWAWLQDPTLIYVFASNKMGAATKKAKAVQTILQSDIFTLFFQPYMAAKHGKRLELTSTNITRFSNNYGGTVICASTNAEIIGEHAHILDIDDPQSVAMSKSPAYREQTDRFVFEALPSRVKDANKSLFILIMQRLHEADTTAMALRKWHRVRHIVLPAKLTEDVRPETFKTLYNEDGFLEPIRLGQAVLDDYKSRLDAYGFSGQMMQKPAPSDGVMIREEWFPETGADEWKAERARGGRLYLVIDGAYGRQAARRENDPTGIDVFCLSADSQRAFWPLSQDVDLEMPELVKHVSELAERIGIRAGDSVLIEPKASGHSLSQSLPEWMKHHTSLIGESRRDGADQKNMVAMSKTERVRYVQPALSRGVMAVPAGADWWPGTKKQLTAFPLSAHDEHVDTLCYFVGIVFIQAWGELLFERWQSAANFSGGAAVFVHSSAGTLAARFGRGWAVFVEGDKPAGAAEITDGTVRVLGAASVRKGLGFDEMRELLAGLDVGLEIGGGLAGLTRMGGGMFSAVAAAMKYARNRRLV